VGEYALFEMLRGQEILALVACNRGIGIAIIHEATGRVDYFKLHH
jgi:hypothetical protein